MGSEKYQLFKLNQRRRKMMLYALIVQLSSTEWMVIISRTVLFYLQTNLKVENALIYHDMVHLPFILQMF